MSADKRNDACSTPVDAECYRTEESHISRARRPRAVRNQFPMSPNNLAVPPAAAARRRRHRRHRHTLFTLRATRGRTAICESADSTVRDKQ